MTILSYGFDGSLAEKEFSILMTLADAPGGAGATGTVASLDDFLLTPVTGYRSYTVGVGTSYAAGVMAVSDALETITLPAPTAWGQWHLLVLRRDWSANTTKFVSIPADEVSQMPGSIPANDPADLRSSAGIIHDHKIGWALVQKATTGVTLYRICQLAPWYRKARGTSAERDYYLGNPGSGIGQRIVNGAQWYNTEGEWEERYYQARVATSANTLDVGRPAGWYPIAGHMPQIEYMHLAGYNQTVATGTGDTVVTGIDSTTRNYWGSGGLGEPSLGIGYQGNGVFALFPGRWSFTAYGNYQNATSGTFRALGARTTGSGLITHQRVQAGGSGIWNNISGVFNAAANDTFWLITNQDSGASQQFHLQSCRLTYLGPN